MTSLCVDIHFLFSFLLCVCGWSPVNSPFLSPCHWLTRIISHLEISKDSNKKGTRQTTNWEKNIIRTLVNKGLVTRIYKELLGINNKKADNPIEKNGQKKEWKCYLILQGHSIKLAEARKTDNTKCSQKCPAVGTPIRCWGECKLVQSLLNRFEKQFVLPSKVEHDHTIRPSHSATKYMLLGNFGTCVLGDRYLNGYSSIVFFFFSALFIIGKNLEKPKCS